ncbi:hypothetical protein, partial [Paenibacillus abyssi]|uniref:hypothetical protein n=1 Tax=Paenibacillus abyssi TaxID=1340531 RepID=UPI0016673961
GVEAQQCVQLTNTNRSRAYPNNSKTAKVIHDFRIRFSGRNALHGCHRVWYALHNLHTAFGDAVYLNKFPSGQASHRETNVAA